MYTPKRIFFTGVPGSRWSGIAQVIESLPGMNTTDRTPSRDYTHHEYTGHKGAYFGRDMELPATLSPTNIDSAHTTDIGTRLIKSHDWAYVLQNIKNEYPDDWIMLVYRPDLISYAWWHEAGGFKIKYPNYTAYSDSINMLSEIQQQNKEILKFANKWDLVWNHLSIKWVTDKFGAVPESIPFPTDDILVTILK